MRLSHTTKRLFNSFTLKASEPAIKYPFPLPPVSKTLFQDKTQKDILTQQLGQWHARPTPKQDKIAKAVQFAAKAYENDKDFSIFEGLDLKDADVPSMAALLPKEGIFELIRRAESQNLENLDELILNPVMQRSDLHNWEKLSFSLKISNHFISRDSYDLLLRTLKPDSVDFKMIESQGRMNSGKVRDMFSEHRRHISFLTSAYEPLFGRIRKHESSKMATEMAKALSKDEQPEQSAQYAFTPSPEALVTLVRSISIRDRASALVIFYRHFPSLSGVEKRMAKRALDRAMMMETNDNAQMLFNKYCDETNRGAEDFVPPTESMIRRMSATLTPVGLTRTIFNWKYAEYLTDLKTLDSLNIVQRKLAFRGQLDRVYELVQEVPFSPEKIQALEAQFKEEFEQAEKERLEKAREAREQRDQERKDKKEGGDEDDADEEE